MYYLANGKLNTNNVITNSELGQYIVATIENGFGYQSCLICSKTKTLLKSMFSFDKDKAIKMSENTFNVIIKATFKPIA